MKSESPFKEFIIFSGRKGNKCSKRSMVKVLWIFQRATGYLLPDGLAPSLKKGSIELHPEGGQDKRRWDAEKVSHCYVFWVQMPDSRVPQLLVPHLYHYVMKPKYSPSLLGLREIISSSLFTHLLNHFFCSHDSSYHSLTQRLLGRPDAAVIPAFRYLLEKVRQCLLHRFFSPSLLCSQDWRHQFIFYLFLFWQMNKDLIKKVAHVTMKAAESETVM